MAITSKDRQKRVNRILRALEGLTRDDRKRVLQAAASLTDVDIDDTADE